MDTARITAEHLIAHGIAAKTFLDSYDDLPFVHVTQTRTERNTLFGLDTLSLTVTAHSRDDALRVLEEALALADGGPVFHPRHGLIDRLEALSAPVPASLAELFTASAEVTAEYRL